MYIYDYVCLYSGKIDLVKSKHVLYMYVQYMFGL